VLFHVSVGFFMLTDIKLQRTYESDDGVGDVNKAEN
jgi:hypothetical protein